MPVMFAYSESSGKADIRQLRQAFAGPRCYPFAMRLRLKELRQAKGLTQAVVAARAAISISYLSELESGKKGANSRRIEALARALGVSPVDLIDDRTISAEVIEHIRRLERLSPEDRAAVIRHAIALDPGEPDG